MSAYSEYCQSLTPSLYWALNSTTAGTDLSGNSRTGTGGGSITIGGFASSPIAGETTSTDFDGSNDRITSTYSPFTAASTRTFTGWLNIDTFNVGAWFGGAGAAQEPWIFALDATNILFRPDNTLTAGQGLWSSGFTLTTGTWFHYALVHSESGDSASLYLNGSLVAAVAVTDNYSSAGTYTAGALLAAFSQPFDGKMAHLAVFERALTSAEIASLYDSATPRLPVRELPPLRMHVLATTPGGYTFRWGDDERRADDVPAGLSFSTIVPGGFETLECELPRRMETDYADLRRLTTLTAIGPGGRIAAEARLEKAPRVSGDTLSVSPQAVGHQAHLADDEGAAEVYVDRDLSAWGPASAARRISLLTTSGYETVTDPSVSPDTTTGIPAVNMTFDAPGTAMDGVCEAWYDAGVGVSIGSIYYDLISQNTLSTYIGFIGTSSTDTASATSLTADLMTGTNSSASGTHTASPTTYRFGIMLMGAAGITPTVGDHTMLVRRLAVFGSHGLTKRGTAPSEGFYASDVIANAVGRWAPQLRFTTGTAGTIAPSTFVIPQLSFSERTTADAIIKEADRFHLWDWAVWEGSQPNQPTFYYQDRGARGKRWRARVRPAKLEETGPQVDKLFNGVYVRYTDAAGTTFTVGPTGTSADTTSANLIDTDPLNPANQVGIKRYTTLDMGIMSTAEAATEVGRRFLEQSKLHDNSGSAELVGHVEDDRGVIHPAWAVRAGDEITFTDAADPSSRRIVHTSYDHDSRTNSLDLDSPPEGLESLLERLGVAVAPGSPSVASGSPAPGAGQDRPGGPPAGPGGDRPGGSGSR